MTNEMTLDFTTETHGKLSLTIAYEVCGRYIPASWGYAGGSPEEFPEVSIVTVTGETEDGEEKSFDESDFTAKEWARLEEYVNEDANSPQEGPEPDE